MRTSGGARSRAVRVGIIVSAILVSASLAFIGGGLCGCSHEEAREVEQPSEEVQEVNPMPSDTGAPSASQLALEEAKRSSLPALLNFHSTQCIPCIEIEKVIKEVEPEYAGRVAFIIVDVYDPSEYELCMQYNIQTIPTTVFLDGQGQFKEGYIGVIDVASMRQILDRLVSGTTQ